MGHFRPKNPDHPHLVTNLTNIASCELSQPGQQYLPGNLTNIRLVLLVSFFAFPRLVFVKTVYNPNHLGAPTNPTPPANLAATGPVLLSDVLQRLGFVKPSYTCFGKK